MDLANYGDHFLAVNAASCSDDGNTQPNTMNKDKVAGPFLNLNNWCVWDTVRANIQRYKYHYYQYQTPN